MKAGRLATIALAVFALLALTLGAYVGGYFWLGRVTDWDSPLKYRERDFYPHRWARDIFQPAVKVESWVRGCEVRAVYGADFIFYGPIEDTPAAEEIPPDSLNR